MAPAKVTLWEGRLDLEPARMEALRACLDEVERRRASAFPDDRARGRWCAGRGILRSILGLQLGIPPDRLRLETGEAGKPFLPDHPDLHFNLSHADDRLLVAVSHDVPVGVDIERLPDQRSIDALARRALSDPERGLLAGLEAEARPAGFAELWTRKEAYVKAEGRGLGMGLDSLDAASDPPRVLVRDPSSGGWRPGPWTVRSVSLDAGYAGAVAAKGENWDLERRVWRGEPGG